jgi:hypothetical protein
VVDVLYVVQKYMKILLTIIILMTGMGSLSAEDAYKEYAEDIRLLRDTTEIPMGSTQPNKTVKASSAKAIAAANQLFSKISFLHKTRDEVIAILGDPATISDYGIKAKPGKDEDLIYWFDSGYGGTRYTIKFRADRAWSVSLEHTD